ncbi:MAG: pyridoxal-phosphate dependent enzyme [Spirochaetales bacterium]|nr:pyridoxal-phosphate dependent enzyme [Spirochaetales bacterium]
MLDLTMNEEIRKKTAKYFKEKGIKLPTFDMMINPDKVPEDVKKKLKETSLWDVDPVNLYRISWKNEAKESGGLFGAPNYIVIPPSLSGVPSPIVVITGKWFPTGAHKVGATYGCLVPRLVTGQFDPQKTKAVWPSTGNYCRGGAYISALMACKSIAILPEEMSAERFEWLKQVAGEIIATPGCESNVKEIFDKCNELEASGEDLKIFNQFDELGNPNWHYNVTGRAVQEALEAEMKEGQRLAAYISSSGSGGTLGAGYYLKTLHPGMKITVSEALQCPTIYNNGFGGHRIEGIGDKHIPWIHDCKNTDCAAAIDDEEPLRLLELFNTPEGKEVLKDQGVSPDLIDRLNLLGISGIANILAAIKQAKYFEMTEQDVLVTVATDSYSMYESRVKERAAERPYSETQAIRDMALLKDIDISWFKELNYYDRKAVHNLKYFTWIEQQGHDLSELNDQWYDDSYWNGTFNSMEEIDKLINDFNDLIDRS